MPDSKSLTRAYRSPAANGQPSVRFPPGIQALPRAVRHSSFDDKYRAIERNDGGLFS